NGKYESSSGKKRQSAFSEMRVIIPVSLGQISILKSRIKYFPLIKESVEGEFSIGLMTNLEFNENFYVIEPQLPFYDGGYKPTYLDQILMTSRKDINILKDLCDFEELGKNSRDVKNISSFEDLLRLLYKMMMEKIIFLQNSFFLDKQNSENLLKKCKSLIDSINSVIETAIKRKIILVDEVSISNEEPYVFKGNVTEFVLDEKEDKSVVCDICGKTFKNPNGLGGHMSRVHPNKSQSYKIKRKIREKRCEFREAVIDAKLILAKNHGLDYDKEEMTKEVKKKLCSLVKENRYEYRKIVKGIKNERMLPVIKRKKYL
ncbi:MAG: C2H2-type zinc finger protein, partial [archaeon]|nr:C2H2-type zinc finger protein [archaeon]